MSAEKKYTEEDIEKMKHTVDIVFRAELAISDEWKPKLKDMLVGTMKRQYIEVLN